MASLQRIWIVGRSGRLGSALEGILSRQSGVKIFSTDIDDLDLRNLSAVEHYADRSRPHIIVNCAAKADRAWCQANPDESFKLHALGARNLAIASEQVGAHLIHLSSDFVFDGLSHVPYREFDAVSPQTVYGATKLAGEQMVKEHARHATIIRSSWLYGKKTLHESLTQAAREGKVTISHPIVGSPTSSLELAEAVIPFFTTREFGTYHMSSEGECTLEEFIRELLTLVGKDVPIETIDEAGIFELMRPPYSVLDNYMLRMTGHEPMADWKEGLARFVRERQVGKGIL